MVVLKNVNLLNGKFVCIALTQEVNTKTGRVEEKH